MNSTLGVVLALLFLCCCLQIVSTQQPSPAFYEFLGYLSGIEKNKPINWTASLYFLHTGQVSPRCFTDAYTVHNDTLLVKSYAGQMLDSTGKFTPSGMFKGNWLAVGDYRECTVDVNNAVDRPENVKAMYCLVTWTGIPEELSSFTQYYNQGVCVPKSCSDSEIQNLTWTGFLGVKPMPSWYPVAVNCQREETYNTYSAGAIVALIIIAIMLGILGVSTFYEFAITIPFLEEERKYLTTSGVGRFFLSCSVYSNTKKMFDTYQHPGQLPALHGIRVISTLWIIFGHTDFYTINNMEIANKGEKSKEKDQWWYFILGNMDMAVDTFLFLSGLLVTYLFMKQMKKTGGEFTWGDYGRHVLHRYFRLTPVYAFLIMVYACLVVYMGSGPWWAIHDNWAMIDVRATQTYWWASLLYINNYVGQRSFVHGWYLAVDMQLYVTVPGVLILLYKKPRAGVVLTCCLLGSGVLLSGLMYHFIVTVATGGDYVHTTYMYTVTRMAPYFIGTLLGYLLFKTNRKVPNTPKTKMLVLLGWMVGTVCALVALVTPSSVPKANLKRHPAWRAFDRSLFSTGVAWVVYACCVGYGGIVSEFLSWSGWLPLSRLTYSAYLVHPIIMQVYYMSYKGALLYSEVTWWFLFVSFSFMAFVCGFAASMMVEVPFLELEKFVLPKRRGREVKSEGRDARPEKLSEGTLDNAVPGGDKDSTELPLLYHSINGTIGSNEAPTDDGTDSNIPACSSSESGYGTVNRKSRSK